MKKLLFAISVALVALSSCGKRAQNKIVILQPKEELIIKLDTLSSQGILYGHQDDPFYGLSWQWDHNERSDTKELLGDYPAIMGFDLGGIELGDSCNLDTVPFEWIRKEAIAQYYRGGFITFSWHPRNPRTGGNAWDVSDTATVHNILPGGEQYELFQDWMAKVATFLKTIKTVEGISIPIILRPWHEYNGSWFWWGQNNCSNEDFKALWNMFQDYMNKEMPRSLVWGFSPNLQGTWTVDQFMSRYPGDDRVSLIGCDAYQWGSEEEFMAGFKADINFLDSIAKANHKVFAITECGKQNSPTPDWWSRVFFPCLEGHHISYFLPWRNWHADHFGFSKDATTADDVKELYNQKRFLIVTDVTDQLGFSGRSSSEIIWM